MAIEWNEELATGVDLIDTQHKELLKRANALLEATSEQKGKAEVKGVIAFLEDYVAVHFEAEENAMQLYQYPEYTAHKAHHTTFLKSFAELKAECERTGATDALADAAQRRVIDWILTHIMKVDKVFAAYLKEKGIDLK